MPRFFKRILWLLILLGGQSAFATTYYFGIDGGTISQCDGRTNHALAGASGTNCRLSNPLYLVNSSGAYANFTGGDTMQFVDQGPYYIGEQNGGVGTDFQFIVGGCPAPNTNGNSCILPPIPSGTSGAHTKIIGTGVHNSNHTGLTTPTVWSGINNIYSVLNLQGSAYVDVSGMEITQPDNCTLSGRGVNNIDKTALSGGVGTYNWYFIFNNPPLVTQRVTVEGTANGSGALNGSNLVVATQNFSSYTITGTHATNATTFVYTYTLISGEAPRVGETFSLHITGTTNGGGIFNLNNGGDTVAASTGTTFTVTPGVPASGAIAFQAETGSGTDDKSGVFTVNGIAGSASPATDSGTVNPSGFCSTGVNNFAETAIVFQDGTSQGPSNLTMTDMAVIATASRGIRGSKLNLTSGDVTTLTDLYIIASGYTGIDGDGGAHNTCCESVGTVNASYIDIEWSGCIATTRVPLILSNTIDLCYSQNADGQGDGWVTIAAGDMNLNVDHSQAHNNVQDGFDLLHLSDDIASSPNVSITNSQSTGNEGQTFKLGAGTTMSAINDFAQANCHNLYSTIGLANFPSLPTGWNAGIDVRDDCRASGDQWSFQFNAGTHLTFRNNTTTGYGATMVDMGCAPLASGCDSTVVISWINSIQKGYPDPISGIQAAGFFCFGGGSCPFGNAGAVIDHNIWNTMRTGSGCGQIPEETNCSSADPLLVSQSNINAINPNLTGSSPAISAGTTPCPSTGTNGHLQTSPCTIGAYVFASPFTGTSLGGNLRLGGNVKIQ